MGRSGCGRQRFIEAPDYRESSAGGGPRGLEGSPIQEATLWPMVFRRPIGDRARLLHAGGFRGAFTIIR